MIDVFCVGQLVCDILVSPVTGVDFTVDTQDVDTISMKPGGDCLNTAAALSKLGCKVAFSGKIGDDMMGGFLKNTLIDSGIDIRSLSVAKTEGTSSVIVAVNPAGERTFLYCSGANGTFGYEDIDLSLIGQAKAVHVGGTFKLPLFDGAGAARLFKAAKDAGKQTSMDNTWDVTGRWLDTIRPCFPYLDYYMPSYGEARLIAGCDGPEEIAGRLLAEGVSHVVLKMGRRGGFYKDADQKFYFPAFDVPVKDTTGAGDCFVAGFLAALLRREPPEDAARLAAACSAFCIQSLGATAGVPDMETLEGFLSSGAAKPLETID